MTFHWNDPFLIEQQLSAAEITLQNKARQFAQNQLTPKVVQAFREETFDPEVIAEMGRQGFLGATLKDYGCIGANHVSYGLIAHEIEKVDSAYRSALSIQSGLVMHAIHTFGSDAQKKNYLPELAKGKIIGAFGLTEPLHGSDPGGMETTATLIGNEYVLNGHKKWIGLAPHADIFVIWAKDEQNRVRGFLVEKKTPGLSVKKITGKLSLRAASVGEIVLEKVKIAKDTMLPLADGLSAPFSCLDNARYGIAWGALGAAEFCWHAARDYVLQRTQFNQPLAANQLIQFKLANMQTQISIALQACLRAGRMKDENLCASQLISLIKRNSALVALDVARHARDMLGANGIDENYHVMRHLMNLETVNTYEGTQDIHALILGYTQTNIQAFRAMGDIHE